jgi:hypothetical protein
VRTFLAVHRDGLVLGLLLAGVTLVVAAFVAPTVALGPGRAMEGAVVGLASVERDGGTQPGLLVQVGDRRVRLGMSRGHGCVVGDRIALVEHTTLLGRRYAAGRGGCSTPISSSPTEAKRSVGDP